jgi:hypothetical protein
VGDSREGHAPDVLDETIRNEAMHGAQVEMRVAAEVKAAVRILAARGHGL